MSTCHRLFSAGRIPAMASAYPVLMLQTEHDGGSIAATIAVFASVWRIRAASRNISGAISPDVLHGLVVRAVECPWLVGCMPSDHRKARRNARIRAPLVAPERAIYRSDGASRGQGQAGSSIAGWGAALWKPTEEGLGAGPPDATAHGHLGEGASNNVAEYVGLCQCMRRATRGLDPNVVFQVDSKLVAQQLAKHGAWACRSPDLIPLRDECRALGTVLDHQYIIWEVRHIYREFNQAADALANQGVDNQNHLVQDISWRE